MIRERPVRQQIEEIESEYGQIVTKTLDFPNISQQVIRSAIIDTFELKEVNLTIKNLAYRILSQLEKLEEIQKKALIEYQKDKSLKHSLPIVISASKVYLNWMELIYKLRGATFEIQNIVQQQFTTISKDKTIEDYVLNFQSEY